MSMATAEPMIEVNDLWKAFGALQVLKGISLDVPGGSAVALIGPSGAGKSTRLRCINLLGQPGRGRVRGGGQAVDCAGGQMAGRKQTRGFRARTGMVFQLFNLFRPPPAKIRPGRPAPTMGPGTSLIEVIVAVPARLLDSRGQALNFAQSCAGCSLVGDQAHVSQQKNSRCSLTVPISMPPPPHRPRAWPRARAPSA